MLYWLQATEFLNGCTSTYIPVDLNKIHDDDDDDDDDDSDDNGDEVVCWRQVSHHFFLL